jgi:hypothetical protein
MIGRNGIEVMPIRKAAIGQLLRTADILVRWLAHWHQDNPLASRCCLCRVLYDRGNISHRAKASDRNPTARLEAFAISMRMGIKQSWQDRATAKIDQLGRWSRVSEQGGAVANCHDATRTHRDGLRQPRTAVERDDVAPMQDQVRRKHRGPFRSISNAIMALVPSWCDDGWAQGIRLFECLTVLLRNAFFFLTTGFILGVAETC